MKLSIILRAQSTHCGQISDRSVANFRRKSQRKKIKKPIRGVKHYILAAATLRYADAAGSIKVIIKSA